MISKVLFIVYIIVVFSFIFLNYYLLIPYLKKLKFGQTVRELGPRSHLQKNGTPTMGGIIIFISFIFCFISLLIILNDFIDLSYNIVFIFVPIIGYFMIGLIDDLLIICKKNNTGLKPIIKFILELVIALIFYIYLIFSGYDTKVYFFTYSIDLIFFYGLLIILMFTSTTNATNLTDGLDGLLACTTLPILIGYVILGIHLNNYIVVILSISLFIALLAFLFFNFPKAKLFMGDTGSLFIGAIISLIPILLKVELLLIIFGMMYVIETLSVIIQVVYFKYTKGKRLLKMAPFHHHLELSGFSDIKIDCIFFILSSLFTIFGLLLSGVIK